MGVYVLESSGIVPLPQNSAQDGLTRAFDEPTSPPKLFLSPASPPSCCPPGAGVGGGRFMKCLLPRVAHAFGGRPFFLPRCRGLFILTVTGKCVSVSGFQSVVPRSSRITCSKCTFSGPTPICRMLRVGPAVYFNKPSR